MGWWSLLLHVFGLAPDVAAQMDAEFEGLETDGPELGPAKCEYCEVHPCNTIV